MGYTANRAQRQVLPARWECGRGGSGCLLHSGGSWGDNVSADALSYVYAPEGSSVMMQ